MLRPVSVITVTAGGYFFVRLLVEKVREFIGEREYEIIAVDRGSKDGTTQWLKAQPDVRVLRKPPRWFTKQHHHGEAAEAGARIAKHEAIVLLDSDAFPISGDWLALTVDKLDEHNRLAGASFPGKHAGNPYGWYIHPQFMAFLKSDLDSLVVLRKVRGHTTDTGEEATIRLLDAGKGVIGYPIEPSPQFAIGNIGRPTVSAGVFHAWHVTRLLMEKEAKTLHQETQGAITRENYLFPLLESLRKAYNLTY